MAFDYAKYLSNLLIIQYHNKPKAKATIEAVAKMFPPELFLLVRDGFSLDTATGKQLDILAKYLQADRHYTNSSSQPAELSDEEFRVLLKLKAICNTGSGSNYGIDTALYNFFKLDIRAIDDVDTDGHHTMSMSYRINTKWTNVARAALQQDILPHPAGVGVSYSISSDAPTFALLPYNGTITQFITGFRTYDDLDKEGQMLTYDKII